MIFWQPWVRGAKVQALVLFGIIIVQIIVVIITGITRVIRIIVIVIVMVIVIVIVIEIVIVIVLDYGASNSEGPVLGWFLGCSGYIG